MKSMNSAAREHLSKQLSGQDNLLLHQRAALSHANMRSTRLNGKVVADCAHHRVACKVTYNDKSTKMAGMRMPPSADTIIQLAAEQRDLPALFAALPLLKNICPTVEL